MWTAWPQASSTQPTSSVLSRPSRSRHVFSNINSFLLGARSVNPDAEVQVIFTGDWSLPVREAEAANALVDAGCDVLTCHVDGPKVVIETAEGRGVKAAVTMPRRRRLAPKGFITGAEYKWETIYKMFADMLAKGETLPNVTVGGYDNRHRQEHALRRRRHGSCIAAADAAIARRSRPASRSSSVRSTSRTATLLLAAGESFDNYEPVSRRQTDYLIEGVVGSIT
jgi:basic membrane protein A